jgi:hypothetical protein
VLLAFRALSGRLLAGNSGRAHHSGAKSGPGVACLAAAGQQRRWCMPAGQLRVTEKRTWTYRKDWLLSYRGEGEGRDGSGLGRGSMHCRLFQLYVCRCGDMCMAEGSGRLRDVQNWSEACCLECRHIVNGVRDCKSLASSRFASFSEASPEAPSHESSCSVTHSKIEEKRR